MVDVFRRRLDRGVESGLVADGTVVPAPFGLEGEVSEPEVAAHPDGVQQRFRHPAARDGTGKGDGEWRTGECGDGVGVGIDRFVPKVKGSRGDVYGLVGDGARPGLRGEGARKGAFLQQSGRSQGLLDAVDDVSVVKVRCFVGHSSVFICRQK